MSSPSKNTSSTPSRSVKKKSKRLSRSKPANRTVRRLVKILPAPVKNEMTITAMQGCVGVTNTLGGQAQAQNLVNPGVTGQIVTRFPETCVNCMTSQLGAGSSAAAFPLAVNGVRLAQKVPLVTIPQTPEQIVIAKREASHNGVLVQSPGGGNEPPIIPQCEAAQVPIRSASQEAAVASHSPGSKATYIHPPLTNTPLSVVPVALPVVGASATTERGKVKPVSAVRAHAKDSSALVKKEKMLAIAETTMMVNQAALTKVPKGISFVEASKPAVSWQGSSAQTNLPSEEINAQPVCTNTDVLPAEETDMPSKGETAASTSHASAVSQYAPPSIGSPTVVSAGTQSTCDNDRQTNYVPGSSSADIGIHFLPFFPPAIVEEELLKVKLPFGSTKTIEMTREDLRRHIPVWNRKQNYKLAGTSAPLGKNLRDYLQKKNGEYELYTNQDRRKVTGGKGNARVTLWNKVEFRKISGTSAPLKKNIKKYLEQHPECEIYNGQAEKLDPAVKHLAHNRVTLWNKITHRRTGFGSAGPLRKNLSSYLQRNPHLEEYTGQDKKGQERAPIGKRRVTMRRATAASREQVQTNHHQDQNRWHSRRPCKKRPRESCSGEDLQETPDALHALPSTDSKPSPKRYRPIDLSELPDLNVFPPMPTDGEGKPLEWYESLYQPKGTDIQDSLNSAKKEEGMDATDSNDADGLYTPANKEQEHIIVEAEEEVKPEPNEPSIRQQIDGFLDPGLDGIPLSSINPPLNEHDGMDPSQFLNIDVDMDDNSFFPYSRENPLCPLTEEPEEMLQDGHAQSACLDFLSAHSTLFPP